MTQIKIKDLRGVGDVELDLDDSKRVFVFFGSNGVGKTKTLEILALYFLQYTENNQHYDKNNLTDLFHSFSDSLTSTFNEFYEAWVFLGANKRSYLSKSSNVPSIGDYLCEKAEGKILSKIKFKIEQGNFSEFGMDESIHNWFLERAKSVNPYQKEEDNRKIDIDTVLNALNILDNRIEKTLKIDGDGNVFLTVEGQERELSELSSGFISVVKIIQSIISAYSAFTNATDLLNVKGVVLIDEIESHLHIEWQTKIVTTLKNLFPNTTFYIATHSPLVLSQLDEGEAYLLKRADDNVVRSEKINSPNTRLLANVLQDTFGVDLNTLKRDNMANIDQSQAKQRLLNLLNSEGQP